MEDQEPMQVATAELPKNGQSRTELLSSNWTLYWRVFVPIFFTVFFSVLTLAFWLTDARDLYLSLLPVMVARICMTAILLGWLFFVSRTLWRLKRVDADDAHFFATNYWQTVRYPWHDIDRIEEKKRLGRRVVNIWLKAPGRFGQVISFLPGTSFDAWMDEHGKAAFFSAN